MKISLNPSPQRMPRALVCILFFLSGLAGTVSASGKESKVSKGSFYLTLQHDGLTRKYLLHVPASYDGKSKVPLLFNFHGFGGKVADYVKSTNMRPLADEENFLLVYPQGTPINGFSHWNAATPSKTNKSDADDLGFVKKMIASISVEYEVDPKRIYACGYSNGAFFSYYLGCYLSESIAAVGSVSGTMLEESYEKGKPSRRVPMINLHGTADNVVPYEGKKGLTPIPDVISFWVKKNATRAKPELNNFKSGRSRVRRSVYSDDLGIPWIEHYKIKGGRHIWFEFELNGLDANRLIWDFFSKHDLNGPRQKR